MMRRISNQCVTTVLFSALLVLTSLLEAVRCFHILTTGHRSQCQCHHPISRRCRPYSSLVFSDTVRHTRSCKVFSTRATQEKNERLGQPSCSIRSQNEQDYSTGEAVPCISPEIGQGEWQVLPFHTTTENSPRLISNLLVCGDGDLSYSTLAPLCTSWGLQ